jgi:hypothetical protein
MLLRLKIASLEDWEQAYNEDADCAYSQGVSWNALWAGIYGYELVPQRLFSNDEYLGLLPLAVKKRVVGSSFISGIHGYGGVLGISRCTFVHYSELYSAIARKYKSLNILANPFSGSVFAEWPFAGPGNADSPKIQFMDLRQGFESQFRKWSKGHGSAAKKAIREGITVASAHAIQEWKEYYEVYRDSLRRWGETTTSYYPWEIFQQIFDTNDKDNVKLWLAHYGEQVIAGALCLYGNRHAAYWHGAFLEEYSELKAPHLLQYRIAEDAASRGFYWHDLLSSGGHLGVEKFKRGFATDELSLLQINTKPLIYKKLSELKRQIKRR